jgi:hypothetical protein
MKGRKVEEHAGAHGRNMARYMNRSGSHSKTVPII